MDNYNKKNKLVIFMHIPKTGGGTLNSILKKQYEETEIVRNGGFWGDKKPWKNHFSDKQIQKLQCIRGHFPFGIHEQFPKTFTYCTMLRNPVERVISLYYHIITSPQNRMYQKAKNLNMKQFLEKDVFKIQTKNLQTRQFSGGGSPDLQLAKENLKNYFSVVGITEMYNESLFFMSQELGWSNLNINYKKKHVNPNRLTKDQLPEEVIDIIKKNNQLDMELYEFAKNALEEKINNLDSITKQKLENFSPFS
ncbi:sulfotransferase family 2 domain-containing protein [Lederbergia citrea]|uniref:Sulfotransferase family 2 domain-containing protein n=1 Tax=Lederbergia citrea TaxID=2833581 RepID=A0A942USF0_9BACI|nr:sulfotransferase family 2 domain-containing protein [Lederbergia citrea]MBS4176684.1 sulfotransferase family 2 domain-containing protein [Lederbergia citrea]MBS4203245.1 sulfotransferase family 2 domain-containing protein [Lederbergia citrea]MBS4222084.1 sulfotransferase family 2 domain-containing protein [Lederbergia citrea]